MIAASSTRGHHRLEQLYEVSKLFNAFASVDETVGKALQVVAATLPLESAFLIHAGVASHTEITMWRCKDNAPAGLVAARAHAEALYTYLVGARSVDTLDVHDLAGSATLPAPRDRRVATEHTRRFVMIPLVVGRGMVFGALQLEAASDLDRDDVEFVNALANQLAIALDRDRTRRHDVVRRREAQLSQARYENVVDRLDAAFVWEADLESHRIRCDRDRVLQVIANLLSNALEVVSRRGSVYLRVTQRENEAVFSVADTGPGIAPADHAHLFEHYWRSPQASDSGIGLGLAIARGIVERHGGRIWVDSELGHGATFFFTMPLATVPALPVEGRREDSQ